MEKIYNKMSKSNFGPMVGGGVAFIVIGAFLFWYEEADVLKGGNIYSGNIIWGIAALVFIGMGIYNVFNYVSGNYKKYFKKSLEIGNISETDLAADIAAASELAGGKVEVGNKYIVLYGARPDVSLLEDLVWAYPTSQTTNYRIAGFIPAGQTTTYKVVMVDKNHMKGEIEVKNEEESQEVLAVLASKVPYMVVGYDDRLLAMEKTNFDQMLQMVQDRKNNKE